MINLEIMTEDDAPEEVIIPLDKEEEFYEEA